MSIDTRLFENYVNLAFKDVLQAIFFSYSFSIIVFFLKVDIFTCPRNSQKSNYLCKIFKKKKKKKKSYPQFKVLKSGGQQY